MCTHSTVPAWSLRIFYALTNLYTTVNYVRRIATSHMSASGYKTAIQHETTVIVYLVNINQFNSR
jgi:hypothetical protein